jgi:hypothetical protein
MNESEVRRLMPADDGLPADRHDLIKQRVMGSIGAEGATGQQRPILSTPLRRRLVPAMVVLLVLAAAGTAAGAALGRLPWQTRHTLEEFVGCVDDSSVEELVATAAGPFGGTEQLFVMRASADAPPNAVVHVSLNAEGEYLGDAASCGASSLEAAGYGELWASWDSITSHDGTWGFVYGHVPPEASTALVTFSDGTSTRIEVQADGYFLGVVARPDIRDGTSSPEPTPSTGVDVVTTLEDPNEAHFPEPGGHIAALDANGTVIAEKDLP